MQKKDLKVTVYNVKRNEDNKGEDDPIESREYITPDNFQKFLEFSDYVLAT